MYFFPISPLILLFFGVLLSVSLRFARQIANSPFKINYKRKGLIFTQGFQSIQTANKSKIQSSKIQTISIRLVLWFIYVKKLLLIGFIEYLIALKNATLNCFQNEMLKLDFLNAILLYFKYFKVQCLFLTHILQIPNRANKILFPYLFPAHISS